MRNNSDACEGGGYILWTETVVCTQTALWEAGLIALSLAWLAQLFLLLAVSADGFLAPNIATITERFRISESLAVCEKAFDV